MIITDRVQRGGRPIPDQHDLEWCMGRVHPIGAST